MKNIFLVGGTMGVGKTTTCQIVKNSLDKSVFLDGDWCWDMHPFQVTEETKDMVMDNICFLLNQFIKCSAYENIIFCWVMHQQAIIDEIVSRLDTANCKIHAISLVCDEQALSARLSKDVDANIRKEDVIDRSIERIPLYAKLNTHKIDVSRITSGQAAELMIQMSH
ncbi:AAA family ATPase [Scatolibacter rhodanostii]|uniref:AAA family ATPase n=1 Tax=Scatolibacter rhodanostii TaxID=2014781 RepID=UPI000C08B1A3|nr:AAA family ATPase [Scatolibacter rhodanostii]